MAQLMIPFIVTMSLGRTIDLRIYDTLLNIYENNRENVIQEDRGEFTTKYLVLNEPKIIFKYLDVPPDMGLHCKAGFIKFDDQINGATTLSIENHWEGDTISVPVFLRYLTEIHKLSPNAQLLKENLNEAVVFNMTHFVSRINYEDWTVIVYDFTVRHPSDKEKVKNEIINTLGLQGEVDDSFIDKFSSLQQNLKELELNGPVIQKHKVYASWQSQHKDYSDPHMITTLLDRYKQRKDFRANPTFVYLQPLKDLDFRFDEVTINDQNHDNVYKMIRLLDDLRETDMEMSVWMDDLKVNPDYDDDEKISELSDNVNLLLQEFYEIISGISQFTNVDSEVFERAFQMYDRTLPIKGGTYHLAFRRLKESIDVTCEDDFHLPVLGQLQLDSDEYTGPRDDVKEDECKTLCLGDSRCRAYSYGENLKVYNTEVGVWDLVKSRCWVLFRSINTASFEISSEISGKVYTHDRKCT